MRTLALLAIASQLAACATTPQLTKEDSDKIVRSVQRFETASKGKWVFSTVTETKSNKFINFFATNKHIGFDFPVATAKSPNAGAGPYKDGDCFTSLPVIRFSVETKRQLSAPEEARLSQFLDSEGIKWSYEYCLSEDKFGKQVGYTHSITGVYLRPATDIPGFVLGVFRNVYLMNEIVGIRLGED